jgi:riboflavin kinase/FMN adenylyltransferase
MRLYRDHHHAELCAASAVAIGNFDGVHLGHQALLRQARDCASATSQAVPGGPGPRDPEAPAGDGKADVAVVSFEPLPRRFFTPDSAPPRLAGPADKLRRLAAHGVDLTWLLRFNGALAGMSAEAFVERILVRGLRARHVVIGEDFRFGRGREGDLQVMVELGRRHGFETIAVPAVTHDGTRISSTAIRAALAEGDLDRAEAMLGRPYSVTGHVVRGRQLGRDLGYPTANLRPWGGATPLEGVFAVRARTGLGTWRDGVASVGVRPAVGGGEPLIEVHLFDFDGDLYGQRLETRFLERLRGEENFDDLGALVAQMKKDESDARAILAADVAG